MSPFPTRRRFLTITAAACALGAGAAALPPRNRQPETRWQGRALGAQASLRIVGLTPEAAPPLLRALERELDRLEAIFSLHRPGSALLRLNAQGRLRNPPAELVELLGLADRLHRATEGAFDPTVQPLFVAAARAAAGGRPPGEATLAAARGLIGWEGVRRERNEIVLARKGAALTLNGIAQGYITDRIAALLRRRGLGDVLVNAGEIAALGRRGDGRGWSAGIAGPGGGMLRRLTLSDRALATSATKGTVLDREGRLGHILDPRRGREATGAALVSVSATRAALADGLSTALCVLPPARHAAVLAAFPDARVEFVL